MGKNAFLRYVQAHDCVKDKVTGCYRVEPVEKEKNLKPKPKNTKPKNNKKEENKKSEKGEPELTKLERKQRYRELKRTLQREWSTEMETDESDKEGLSAPSHFKRYTIQERKIVLQQPRREKKKPGESYNGP